MTTVSEQNKLVRNDPKQLKDLLERAQKGDETTIPTLREVLKEQTMVELCGNLAKHAEDALIRKYAGINMVLGEGLRQKLVSLYADLAGVTPTPLERLLVERIVACWLHLYHLEATCVSKDSLSLELASHYQKCIDRSHKRYLSAIKTLAVVRKLDVPVLQVNIARKQVNMAGACMETGSSKTTNDSSAND